MQVLVRRRVYQYARQECVLKRTVGSLFGLSNFEYETERQT